MKRKVIERELASRKKEQKKNDAFFNKIASGSFWMAFKIVAGVCILLAVLFTIDTFADGSSETVAENEFEFDRYRNGVWGHQTIVIDDGVYTVSFESLYGFDPTSFQTHNSLIFRDPKYITFNSEAGEGIRVDRKFSIYEYFPAVQLLFLIPLGVIFFRKQNAAFFTLWGLTIFLIYPSTLYMLLSRLF